MKQYIVIEDKDTVIKNYEIPYQMKVFYTLSTTSTNLTIRCSIGMLDTYDNSIIPDVFLKNIKEDIGLNINSTIKYIVDGKTIGEIEIKNTTYVAYKTRVGEGGILIEELEVSNTI